ncbi:MAG TPA: polyamine ABC transporter ATP-binding protein [Steroidobacteraceae bacterium]|nr:polyamine ABC transporter ATP-binding protein [Steroidobacteraceae bacterium]
MTSSSIQPASNPNQKLNLWEDPAAVPYVRIEGVSKHFDKFVAVDNVSLNIYRGELFCLLGGSGCGKTTLLRMLAGFEQPTSGKIFIDGVDMSGIPPYERPVNMMFQSYALFPHMTVEQNVAFGLKMEHRARDEIADRVAAMLKLVKLEQFAKRKPHQLSGGQRQRVALARSLIKQPKLLLLDEPLGALDKKLREHTQFELVNIQEQLGVTFVVVTHDQEEAMTLSTRIGVMDHGRIVQIDTPKNIYEFPNTKFVAEFIGSVNLFAGRLIEDEPDHIRVACDELERSVLVDHGISAAPHASVWVALRPEKIQMTLEQPAGAENWTQGVVQDVAYLGDSSIYLVRIASGKVLRVTRPNVSRHDDSITWNQTVYLQWSGASPVVVTG